MGLVTLKGIQILLTWKNILRHRRLSRENQWRIFKVSLLICDLILTALAYRVAYWIRFEQFSRFFQEDVRTDIHYYRLLALGLVVSWLVLNALYGLYQQKNLLGGTREYAKVFRASIITLLILIIASFIDPTLFIAAVAAARLAALVLL
jgi:hypothetical protein